MSVIRVWFFFGFVFFCSPCGRANNNWQTNFASINKSNDNSPQTSKKQRDCGETARDSLAYSCLLKNELLGSAIDDVKTAGEERNENTYTPAAKRSLFKYQSPTKQVSFIFYNNIIKFKEFIEQGIVWYRVMFYMKNKINTISYYIISYYL